MLAVEFVPAAIGMKMTVTMLGSAIPAPIVERLTEDKPEALSIVSIDKPIKMEIGLTPNAQFTVLSVQPFEGVAPVIAESATPPEVCAKC